MDKPATEGRWNKKWAGRLGEGAGHKNVGGDGSSNQALQKTTRPFTADFRGKSGFNRYSNQEKNGLSFFAGDFEIKAFK